MRVIGTGAEEWFESVLKCTVWFVSSGHPSADGAVEYYTVKLLRGETTMTCDCTAGQFGKVCKHRVVVHQLLAKAAPKQEAPKQEAPKQEAPKQTTPAQSVVRLVQYDGRPGKGSKCAQCGGAFPRGEWIALQGGQALHDKCAARPATSTRETDTAMMRCNNKPFSMMR